MRRARGAAIACVLALGGCTFIELAWRQAEGTIVDRVDRWVDLDPDQETALTRRVGSWLGTVRRTRLPAVADFLDGVAARTERGFGTADMEWASDRFWSHYRATVDDVIGWLAPTLAALDRDQRHHLVSRMRASNKDYRAEYVDIDADARRAALATRIIDQVERWTGPLDRRQRELVHDRAADFPDTAPDWYRYRLRMQAGLMEKLERGAPAEVIARHLRAWWIDLGPRRPWEVAATGRLRAGIRELLVELADTLDETQRATAVGRLRDLSTDLRGLAASASEAD